jgi:hypothetical protein
MNKLIDCNPAQIRLLYILISENPSTKRELFDTVQIRYSSHSRSELNQGFVKLVGDDLVASGYNYVTVTSEGIEEFEEYIVSKLDSETVVPPESDPGSDSESDTSSPPDHPLTKLTGFQRDVLLAIRFIELKQEKEAVGLRIRDFLTEQYGDDVYQGRLYPNLDTLYEKNFIDKKIWDKNTKRYILTKKAKQGLKQYSRLSRL